MFESAFERVADEIESGKLKPYEYDLRIEIPLKEGVETFHGKPILKKAISILRNAAKTNVVIELSDINNNHIPNDLTGLINKEIGNRFYGKKKKSAPPFDYYE